MQRKVTSRLIRLLKDKELTLALAESMTCGFASHQLSTAKGTSEVFMGSIVCYSSDVKRDLFAITGKMLKQYTAESQKVTDALAKKLCSLIKADVCLAITGLASDGASETPSKPVGTVFIAVLFRKKIHRLRKRYYGSPLAVKEKATEDAFRLIIKTIVN